MKRGSLLWKVVLLSFMFYSAFQFVELGGRISAKQAEITELKSQIEEQELKNMFLQEMMDEGLTLEQVAQIARDQLGYAYANERVYINVTGN